MSDVVHIEGWSISRESGTRPAIYSPASALGEFDQSLFSPSCVRQFEFGVTFFAAAGPHTTRVFSMGAFTDLIYGKWRQELEGVPAGFVGVGAWGALLIASSRIEGEDTRETK